MKTKNKIILAIVAMFSVTLLFSSNSFENQPRCAKKAKNIQKQIDIADENNQMHRIKGLKISLSKVNKHCSDKDLVDEIKDKIKEKKKDLKEHTKDYNEAKAEKRANKMKKYKSKIDEDNSEIEVLKQELSN